MFSKHESKNSSSRNERVTIPLETNTSQASLARLKARNQAVQEASNKEHNKQIKQQAAAARVEAENSWKDKCQDVAIINDQKSFRDALESADNQKKKILRECNNEHPGGPKFDEVDPSTVQPEQPRNWLNILLYIGLGVCIFVLILMVFKLMSGDYTDELKDKPKKMNDLILFPGLFDEPITLFERGDNQIQDLNQKIDILEKKIKNFDGKPTEETCNDYNAQIVKKPDYKNVKKTLQSCVNDGCSIDKELLKNKQYCIGYNNEYNSECEKRSNKECPYHTSGDKIMCKLAPIHMKDIIQNSYYDNPSGGGISSNFKELQSNIEVTPKELGLKDRLESDISTNEDTVRNMWGSNTSTTSSDTQITTEDILTKMTNMKDSGVEALDKIIEGQDNSTPDSNNICKADGLKDLNEQLQKLKMEKNKSLSYKVLFG